ncbi:protein DBF4 homolog A [Trichomycterus rosablanca]|uniref:protein DBF4 homolog A n=1 Tax=Trichomycterus rosablanca TaxID=2290929 RepID=UPI002F358D90
MKHQSLTTFTQSKSQDPKLDKDGHKKAALKRHQSCDYINKKPLAGRIFYLDLPSNKRSQNLENDIKSLGGTVEKFFSKEIGYLVSSKPEARHVQRLVHMDSPVPSPDSGLSSPHPGSRRDSPGYRGSSQGTADTVIVSRGKSLVEKVVKEKERIQMNRFLANALEWGVKILYIDDIISYIDKKKSILAKFRTATHAAKKTTKPEPSERTTSQKCKAGRICHPFIKVEDASRHYRPFHLQLANMPVCNLRSAAPCSPFLLEENIKNQPEKKPKAHGSGGDRGEKGRKDKRKGHEGKQRRKGGYCECCIVKYDSLKAHLQSEQHQAFSKSDEYLVVDRVISGLSCDFVHISPQIKRVKCSISSPVLVPGAVIGKDEADRDLEVEEDEVTDAFPFWGSHNTERSVRKRCREQSQNAKEDSPEHLDTLQKSQSKRGSFEWESTSDNTLQKASGELLLNNSQKRTRRPQQRHLESRTSPSAEDVRTLEPTAAGFRALGARTSGETCVVSEHSFISDYQAPHKFGTTDRLQKLTLSSGPALVRTEPADINHAQERSLSSKEHDLTTMDNSSGTLQRKVRSLRRRRASSVVVGFSCKQTESLTPQSHGKCSELPSLSASALDLWQLFQSSDGMEEEFKGFYE